MKLTSKIFPDFCAVKAAEASKPSTIVAEQSKRLVDRRKLDRGLFGSVVAAFNFYDHIGSAAVVEKYGIESVGDGSLDLWEVFSTLSAEIESLFSAIKGPHGSATNLLTFHVGAYSHLTIWNHYLKTLGEDINWEWAAFEIPEVAKSKASISRWSTITGSVETVPTLSAEDVRHVQNMMKINYRKPLVNLYIGTAAKTIHSSYRLLLAILLLAKGGMAICEVDNSAECEAAAFIFANCFESISFYTTDARKHTYFIGNKFLGNVGKAAIINLMNSGKFPSIISSGSADKQRYDDFVASWRVMFARVDSFAVESATNIVAVFDKIFMSPKYKLTTGVDFARHKLDKYEALVNEKSAEWLKKYKIR